MKKIVGEVTQIDALKNGKLQYAFATADAIHVVDRNGNALSGFPVKSESALCSGLFVFDYDGTKNYRLICADESPALKNLTVQGKTTTGWKYTGTVPIAQVQHIKINNEDILVTFSHSGTVQALKRNGELKTENVKTLTDWDKSNPKLSAKGNSIEITYITSGGSTSSAILELK